MEDLHNQLLKIKGSLFINNQNLIKELWSYESNRKLNTLGADDMLRDSFVLEKINIKINSLNLI